MKKNVIKLICTALVLVMAMSLASCGLFGGKTNKTETPASTDIELPVEDITIDTDIEPVEDGEVSYVDEGIVAEGDEVVPETPKTPGKPAVSNSSAEDAVAEYVRKNKELAESSANEAAEGMMTCEVEARGTAFVYKYTYTSLNLSTPEEFANAKATFKEQFASASESLEYAFNLIKQEEPNVSAIIYEYFDADGDLIISESFSF